MRLCREQRKAIELPVLSPEAGIQEKSYQDAEGFSGRVPILNNKGTWIRVL